MKQSLTSIKQQVKMKDLTPNFNLQEFHRSEKNKNTDLVEVDLHIYEIIDDTTGLTGSEILTIQLNHFQKELEHALAHGVKRIVFIHGKGKGSLKQAILNKLQKEYPHLSYQDASFKEYGFGATMILLS